MVWIEDLRTGQAVGEMMGASGALHHPRFHICALQQLVLEQELGAPPSRAYGEDALAEAGHSEKQRAVVTQHHAANWNIGPGGSQLQV